MAWCLSPGMASRFTAPLAGIDLTCSSISTTCLLLDAERRIVAVLAGHPYDPGWPKVQEDVFHVLQGAAMELGVNKVKEHRRGTFVTLAHGLSFGGGQEVYLTFDHLPSIPRLI